MDMWLFSESKLRTKFDTIYLWIRYLGYVHNPTIETNIALPAFCTQQY